MRQSLLPWARRGAVIVPILLAVFFIIQLKNAKQPPTQQPYQEQVRLVEVITVPTLTVTPIAIGHGVVRPTASWEAVAQVTGEVIDKHEQLQKGAIISAGSQLMQIDPIDYQLAIAQVEADRAAIDAQIQELEVRAKNTNLSLKIETDALGLLEKDLNRKRKLAEKGTISRASLESLERTLLSQRQQRQSQLNIRDLIPAQRALLKAQLAQGDARLEVAKRNMQQTKVSLPFTGRVASVNFEKNQYVREGDLLAQVDDLQRAEVEVQIPLEQMSALISHAPTVNLLELSMRQRQHSLQFKAEVRLKEQSLQASWQARMVRFSDTLDPKTRTVGAIVEVDDPYGAVKPGVRPPLMKGLFVEVRLLGKPQPETVIIPRFALHDGAVYVMDEKGRLQIRSVEVAYLQPEYAVISKGLVGGESLVVSDLIPAIEGMLLSGMPAPAVSQRLQKQATIVEVEQP
jgi:membrane fusion protein, multidrug efflux system